MNAQDPNDNRRPGRTPKKVERWAPDVKLSSRANRVRKLPSTNSSSSNDMEVCNEKDPLEKRDPEEPSDQTQRQIDFLEHFSDYCPNCAYELSEFSLLPQDTTPEEAIAFTRGSDYSIPFQGQTECWYGTEKEAERKVLRTLSALKPPEGGKPQQCSAFSIMHSDIHGYLIVKTNSNHTTARVVLEDGMVRPMIEPMLSTELQTLGAQGSGPRFYAIVTCPMCEPRTEDGTKLLYPALDPHLLNFGEEARALAQARFPFDPIAQSRTLEQLGSAANKLRRRFTVFFVDRIQPNENAQTTQTGSSLHHSEMEATYFARRNGLTIVKMYIDRDCCKVCAATLGKVDSDIHDVIEIIDWDRL